MTFENITLTAKANIYFDGNVTSRSFTTATGESKSLGMMQEGTYTFGTQAAELMEILGGNCEVKVKGEDTFKTYTAGTSFNVPANSSFDIKVNEMTDYCCSYL